MRKALIFGFVFLVLATLAFIGWRFLYLPAQFEVAEMEPLPAPPPPEPPSLPAEPATTHPLIAEEAPAVATTAVDDSDSIFTKFVTSLFKSARLPDFIYPDRMLRRFVATVDNLPRKELSARLRPVKPAQGMFLVDNQGGILSIAPENNARYERYVRALESIDVAAAVKFYATHYALFQKAYQELGYPKGHFNNRLFEAIDDMLAAPTLKSPVSLLQPKVLYRYADPDLENRSAGQKIMMRMGTANAARVSAVLREVRAELVRYSKPQ